MIIQIESSSLENNIIDKNELLQYKCDITNFETNLNDVKSTMAYTSNQIKITLENIKKIDNNLYFKMKNNKKISTKSKLQPRPSCTSRVFEQDIPRHPEFLQ